MGAELTLRNVTVQAGAKRLLDDVSLQVSPGEFVALIGPNGAGKTTLLRCALGLQRCEGTTTLGAVPVAGMRGRERAARVAWLPQQAMVTEALGVLDFVAGARYRFDEPRAKALQGATRALEKADAAEYATRIVSTLSGGEQQRVAVAALLAQEAPLLLLDEPANHLDPGHQLSMYQLFGKLWRGGSAILCITHDVNLLYHLGDPARVRVVGLREGRVQFESSLAAPSLPDELARLYGVPFFRAQAGGQVALLPGVPSP